MRHDRSILMIVNEFPPVGESGVQRPLKFVKYLSRMGWKVHVITPRIPAKSVLDHSLCSEIPANVVVHHTFSLGFQGKAVDRVAQTKYHGTQSANPLYRLAYKVLSAINHLIFPIDKQIGWLPFAYLEAVGLIRKHGMRNVYITAFPFSAFLIGIALKKHFGNAIKWIADYRDGWQFEPLMRESLPSSRFAIIRKWDERTLRSCDKAVFVTESIRDQYMSEYPWVKNKAHVITNGFDEDDFQGIVHQAFPNFTIVYMGKIYNLNRPDIRPVFRALSSEQQRGFSLVHIGSVTREVEQEIGSLNSGYYRFEGYKDHREALGYAAGADVNLLVINDDTASEGVYTGKLFELLRIGKPILALGPRQSIAGDLIRAANAGEYAWIGDQQAILNALHKLRTHPENYLTDQTVIERYKRENLTRELASLYE